MTSKADKTPAQRLTGKQMAHLRALAHQLSPVVQIGKKGWNEGLRSELDGALLAHELIKVSFGKEAPIDAGAIAVHIEAENQATVVQTIGRILVVYRRHPNKPKIELPKRRGPKGGSASSSASGKGKGKAAHGGRHEALGAGESAVAALETDEDDDFDSGGDFDDEDEDFDDEGFDDDEDDDEN